MITKKKGIQNERVLAKRRISKIHDLAQLQKIKLFSKNLQALRINDPINFYIIIKDTCKAASLTPDSRLIKLLNRLNIPQKVIQWLIDFSKIEKEFIRIERNKILIRRSKLIDLIQSFLEIKIIASLDKNAHLILSLDKNLKPDLKKEIRNYYRRNDYLIKTGSKKSQLTTSKQSRRFFLKFIEGRNEFYHLNQMLSCFIPTTEMDQTFYLSHLAGFFGVICRDKLIWTLEEFENRESSYGNNHQRYLAMRVKRITHFDPSQVNFRHFLIHNK